MKAIWTRDPSDVTDDEYNGFYKALTKDEKGKLHQIHFKAEGEISFRSILYVPKKAADGYYDRFYEKSTALKVINTTAQTHTLSHTTHLLTPADRLTD